MIKTGRFLRRRYKHLQQEDQTIETSPNMLRLLESGDMKRRKKNSALRQKDTTCNDKEALALDDKNPKRSRGGNEVLTNSTPLPDLNGDVSAFKVPGFDLNQISV